MNEEHHPDNEQPVKQPEWADPQSEQLREAEEALRQARADLCNAQRHYWEVLHEEEQAYLYQAEDELNDILQESEKEPTEGFPLPLGQVVDCTLSLVKKYPGHGVLTAGVLGFLAARFLRK